MIVTKKHLPRRAHIGADADLSFLASLPDVASVQPPSGHEENWTIDLKEGAEGRDLLSQCFERRIALSHFDIAPPSLQDVFVSLIERDRA